MNIKRSLENENRRNDALFYAQLERLDLDGFLVCKGCGQKVDNTLHDGKYCDECWESSAF